MRAHDSVIVDGANDSALAAIMSAAMIMSLNTSIEAKSFDQALGVEDGVEVDPDVAVCRPRCSCGDHASTLVADVLLGRTQVFAQPDVLIELLQLILAACALIENAQTIAHNIDALIVARKAA